MKQIFRACSISLVLAAAASAQTPAGPEFLVNTYTTGRQYSVRPAMEPDGDFILAWSRDDGNGDGAFGQRYEASGAPRGGEFQMNAATTGSQNLRSIAVGSTGSFVVVWGDYQSELDIEGRRFDAAGSAIGGEFLVNTFTTGYQTDAHVGRASDGRFVVIWTSQGFDGDNDGIAARRYDASGNPIGSDFVVNAYTTGSQQSADLAVDADGSFVAVWNDNGSRDGSGSAIFGQRYDASANRLGSEFLVNTYTTGLQALPSVSVSPAGGFVVAWRSRFQDGSGYGVVARRFDGAGDPVGSDFVVNTYTTGNQYGNRVAHDDQGNFVVSWTSLGQDDPSSYGGFAQRFSASGARRGAEFQVNTYTTDNQSRPSVASDSVGNFVIAWNGNGQEGSDFGIFAQRFGGLVPATLAVDGPGNRVLEPGEAVAVHPSWRNVNGAPQTFSADLSGISGPAGATYAILDGISDYGTVADGATAACTDCYTVSVSNPATRPILHWDATAVESIVPDTQGQQKGWRLHVGRSFTDVPSSNPFYRFIETLLHHNVTSGCNATAYCPAADTTRDQMAVFVLVAKEGTGYVPPACTTPVFADVPASNPFCRWIEELARRAVVSGCGNGNYCPTSAVTREQMAVFVLRTMDPALSPPACGTPVYGDVPASSGFCRWIEELTRRSVVTGCGSGNYCPAAAVTREQMGVFISATFGLTLYGP